MSYLESNLVSGETIAYRATLHWIVFVPGVTMLAVGLSALIAGNEVTRWGGVSACVVGILFGLKAWLDVKTTEMAVTNKRVVVKRGWISRSSVEILISRIERIGIDQAVFARFIGLGTVIVSGTGNLTMEYEGVANPLAFRRAIMEQIEAESNETA